MAKILIINVPMHGHVNPTLAMTKALVNAGHQVTYLVTEEFRSKIENTGAQFEAYEIDKNILTMPDGLKHIYARAFELAKDCDCLIYEFMMIIGRDIGRKLGKPTVRVYSTFALDEETLSEVFTGGQELPAKIAGIKAARRLLTQIAFRKIDTEIEDVFNEMSCDELDLNITFTSRQFQVNSERFDDSRWQFVGPLVAERKETCDIPFHQFKGKIIYVSLGTLFNNSVPFFKKCIEAFRDKEVTVLMSIGKKIKKQNLGRIPDNFYVAEFVPQLEVLKRADLFITHGGMNSSHEAMYYAVPAIVVPQSIDQPVVARRMEELHLGKVIHKKEVTVEKLRCYAEEILNDKSYKVAMIEMSRQMKSAGGEARAVELIEQYMANKN